MYSSQSLEARFEVFYKQSVCGSSYLQSVVAPNYFGSVSSNPNAMYIHSARKDPYAQACEQSNVQCKQAYHSPDPFLKSFRPYVQFIGEVQEISHHIQDCFKKVTGKSLPDNIIIRICSPTELHKAHQKFSNSWSDGIQGFSINGIIPEVFVKQDQLDKVMVTIGHELGHVISPNLSDRHMEEAKAFAFEIAWVKALRKHDIAGLGACIVDSLPAANGLHDRAFKFVIEKVRTGVQALDLFWELVRGTHKP